MDTELEAAWGLFHDYVWALLHRNPPAALRRLPSFDRQDVISQTLLYCWENDQRILRRYVDVGRPFSHWLCQIANRMAHKEHLRRRRERARHADGPDTTPFKEVPEPGPGLAELRELREHEARVQACVARLGALCRILLSGSGDLLKPRQLARLLGYPRARERNAADQLHECREKLRALVRKQQVAEEAALMACRAGTRMLCEPGPRTGRNGKDGKR
jgi:DNA-directed RNA polymerase specialized sigma24 family protein